MKIYLRLAFAFILIMLALPASSQENADKKYPQYEGIWKTDLGQTALWQAKDEVWGIYDDNQSVGGASKIPVYIGSSLPRTASDGAPAG